MKLLHPFRRSLLRWKNVNQFGKRFFSEEQKSNIRGPVTYGSLGIILLGGAAAAFTYYVEKEEKIKEISNNVVTVGRPALGGPWTLVDHNGIPKTDASYRGKFTLLYFGFTHCPDICPSELVKVGKIMKELEKRNLNVLQPLFISVDPSRDTVGQLRYYAQDFHKDIIYLTGTKEQVAQAARAYRVYFSKAVDADYDSDEEYLVDHSIVLYLNSPDGEFLDFFTQRMTVDDVIEKIAKYVDVEKNKRK